MCLQACVLAAVGSAATTQQGIEARASAHQKGRIGRSTGRGRFVTDATIVLYQLVPVIVRWQPPSISERLTTLLGRSPAIKAAISTAVQSRIRITIGLGTFAVRLTLNRRAPLISY